MSEEEAHTAKHLDISTLPLWLQEMMQEEQKIPPEKSTYRIFTESDIYRKYHPIIKKEGPNHDTNRF